jgi:hypothetical protein
MSPPKKNRKVALKGLAGLSISCLLVWAIVRRVDPAALGEAFSSLRVGWFVFAVVAFGFGFGIAIAGARWRIPLVMNPMAEPWGFVLRMSCVAHCFNVLIASSWGNCAGPPGRLSAKFTRLPRIIPKQ